MNLHGRSFPIFYKKCLTNHYERCIMQKLSRNAAIAQSVERILGKDEVASSNLASSSKKERIPLGIRFLFYAAFKGSEYKCP